MNDSLRTFIAIELKAELQKALASVLDQLKKIPSDVKWVSPGNIHITLKFLGDVAALRLPDLLQHLSLILDNFPSFIIELTGLGAFPGLESPRILWVDVQCNNHQIEDLMKAIDEEFLPLGFDKENKDYHPHITLGRLRSPKNKYLLSKALKEIQMPKNLHQKVENITLMKSTLTSQGPLYEPLGRCPLLAFS